MRLLRTGLTASALALGLVLGGCGFTPMYGTGSAARGLSEIRVETGDERVDFFLQQELLDAMGARNAQGPMYLVTETDVNTSGEGVGADATFTRISVEVRVDYGLFDGQSEAPIAQGRVSGEAAFDSDKSPYAELAAQRDAEERAARIAAQRITIQLARALDPSNLED